MFNPNFQRTDLLIGMIARIEVARDRILRAPIVPRWEAEQISLNPRQIKLLDYLRQSGGSISNREYQTLFGASKRTASNDLSELEAHGLLVVEGAGRATRYRLAQPKT
jgi:ATP-dependent DNA helicase RecG